MCAFHTGSVVPRSRCCVCSYFGVGSFVDTPVAPFGRSDEWSYRTDQPLTPNSADVQNIIDNLELRNGRDYFESQFFALLMVARREAEVGWRAGSRRIAVLATDAPSHEAPEGHSFLTVNNGDGVFDGGDGSEAPPSRQQVIDALIEGMVVPVFLATAGTAHSFYTVRAATMPLCHGAGVTGEPMFCFLCVCVWLCGCAHVCVCEMMADLCGGARVWRRGRA
mgnify:CR=1 FL=1